MIGERNVRLAAVAAMVLLSGCGAAGDSGGPTGLPKPASIKILLPTSELFVGQSIQLTATALDNAGAEIAAGDATWSTTNAAVAQITETGLVQAMAAGTATLKATIAGKTASMGVTVDALPGYDVTVQVTSTFAPASIIIRQFGTVHFVFNGVNQDVTFSTAFPGAPANIPGTTTGTVNREFRTVGDFRFESSVSPGLVGLVKVR